ncbi:MAG TPA: phosphate-starvation-inducible PsiE family protein [Nitrospira sp.]
MASCVKGHDMSDRSEGSNGTVKPRWILSLPRLTTVPDMMQVWDSGIRLTLSLLIATILLGLVGGVIKTFLDLRLLLSSNLDVALRHIIVDALTLLAVVEVLKTMLTYCSDGRVRVTFIVDTVLVVMLTEVISRWFSGGEWQQFAVLGGILATLGAIRVVAVRYSPAPNVPAAQGQQMVLSSF